MGPKVPAAQLTGPVAHVSICWAPWETMTWTAQTPAAVIGLVKCAWSSTTVMWALKFGGTATS